MKTYPQKGMSNGIGIFKGFLDSHLFCIRGIPSGDLELLPVLDSLDSSVPITDNHSNPLDHSRLLDVHHWSEHPEVNVFVNEIYEAHFKGGNLRIRKKHLKVILLDLYVTWSDDPELKTVLPRDVNAYKAKSRYNELHISKLTPEIIDILIEAGLIEQAMGFIDHVSGIGRVSRIWPTGALIEKFEDAKFTPFDIIDPPNRETIILRDRDGEEIEYDDTDETRRMRKLVETYNDLISRTYIDIPTLETNHIDLGVDKKRKRKILYINQRDKFTRRIFNRGSFNKGGRFYGGWWQRCPKEWRHQIFMNNHAVSEIDYSGLHIVILYANRGIDYWREVRTDPYDIPHPKFINNPESLRDVCKQLLLVGLNAKDDKATFSAFRDQAEKDSVEKRYTNKQLGQILDTLRERHEPIANMIANDAGIDLMNQDSRIAEIIIRHFTDKRIPILCVHDSFVVPFGYENELEKQMEGAFEAVTGIPGVKLKEETTNPLYLFPLDTGFNQDRSHKNMLTELDARTSPKKSGRYQCHLDQFRSWQRTNDSRPVPTKPWLQNLKQLVAMNLREWLPIDD